MVLPIPKTPIMEQSRHWSYKKKNRKEISKGTFLTQRSKKHTGLRKNLLTS